MRNLRSAARTVLTIFTLARRTGRADESIGVPAGLHPVPAAPAEVETSMSLITKLFGTFSDKELKRIQPITQKVLDLKPHYEVLSDEELQAVTPALKQRLADG